MTGVVIVVSVIVVIGVVGWFLLNRRHPERAATHETEATDTTSERLYGGTDRPAGPDAETTDPDLLGGDQRPPTV